MFSSGRLSKLPSGSAAAGQFFHQERQPDGLRPRQDCAYRPVCDAVMILCSVYNRRSCLLLFIQASRRPNFKEASQDYARCRRWLSKKRIKAFYAPVFADNLRQGTQLLLQVRRLHLCCSLWYLLQNILFRRRISFFRPLVWVA